MKALTRDKLSKRLASADTTTIVNILQVRKPEIKTLREAKGLVTSDYQVELEEKWMDALHKKYPVQIDEKVLNQVRKRYQ